MAWLNKIAANRHLVTYPIWKVAVIATAAKLFGVLVHIEGFPFGAGRKR